MSLYPSSGFVVVKVGTDVAANTEWSETVPSGKIWQLQAVSVALVQGATQTPRPILIIDNGTTTFYECFGASDVQAESTTCRYNWAPGLTLSAVTGATTDVHATAPLPAGLVLRAGYRVRTSTTGKGANSNYGAPALLVVEVDA